LTRGRDLVLAVALSVVGGVPLRAQVTVGPDSIRAVVPQGQETTVWLSMTNAGAVGIPYCLDFEGPPQQASEYRRVVACGPPGEVLETFDGSDLGDFWIPYGITMTPEGRIFLAEDVGSRHTFEFTPDLTYVRDFRHPVVVELSMNQETDGVTYNEDTDTLWWTNVERSGATVLRVLLLEGTLDGVPTGRRIEIPVPPPSTPGAAGYPTGATYDASRKRYYYVDGRRNEVWAVDTLGVVVPGYPVRLDRYPTAFLGQGVDTHPSEGGPAGVRLEVIVGLVLDNQYDRVVVTDTAGANLEMETPLGALVSTQGGPIGTSVRSRLDPNRIMYVPYFQDMNNGVAAIRPVPLSPTWLSLTDWSGTIPAGGSVQVPLTFRAGQRAPGEYRTTLVVEDTAGTVLAWVPLTMVVTPDTPAEPGPGHAGASLTVAPNPAREAATVTLTVPAPAHARVAVHDVLGREVGVLWDGPLPAGDTRLALPALPAGVYVARAAVAGAAPAAARFVVTR